ncbi:uncharacterized protein A4U43_C08F3890 [Asparagus officinalis]|nr:uncharacterized protein A4U43_C08F3890 [Asparagus officinalis]
MNIEALQRESEMLGARLAAQIICECDELKKLRLKLDIDDPEYLLYFGGNNVPLIEWKCPFIGEEEEEEVEKAMRQMCGLRLGRRRRRRLRSVDGISSNVVVEFAGEILMEIGGADCSRAASISDCHWIENSRTSD